MAEPPGPTELDVVLTALIQLLAAVNIATLEDPSKHRVADTVALAALVARDVIIRHDLESDLIAAVRAFGADPGAPAVTRRTCPCDCHLAWDRFTGSGAVVCPSCGHAAAEDVVFAEVDDAGG